MRITLWNVHKGVIRQGKFEELNHKSPTKNRVIPLQSQNRTVFSTRINQLWTILARFVAFSYWNVKIQGDGIDWKWVFKSVYHSKLHSDKHAASTSVGNDEQKLMVDCSEKSNDWHVNVWIAKRWIASKPTADRKIERFRVAEFLKSKITRMFIDFSTRLNLQGLYAIAILDCVPQRIGCKQLT